MSIGHENIDSDLILLLNQGDRLAFKTIYLTYVNSLYAYARKNIRSNEDCEEVIQEIFVEIWQQRARLTFVKDLKGYLFRLLRFRIAKYFRQEKVRQKYKQHYRLFESLYDNSLVESYESVNLQAVVEQWLAGLPDRCRQAVNLRLQENLSNGEVAARMNIAKKSVENYMVVARAHLKAYCAQLSKQV